MRTPLLCLAAATISAPIAAAPARDVAMFPSAEAGMIRHVIRLPARADANGVRVELRAGKMMAGDCNRRFMGANLSEHNLDGWGFTYWKVKADDMVGSTMMGCPGGPRKPEFISGRAVQMRYNSQLPVVVYAPKGFQVRYRLWVAQKDDMIAPAG